MVDSQASQGKCNVRCSMQTRRDIANSYLTWNIVMFATGETLLVPLIASPVVLLAPGSAIAAAYCGCDPTGIYPSPPAAQPGPKRQGKRGAKVHGAEAEGK